MFQPGSPMQQMPADESALIRRIQELERQMREVVPSIAASFGPVVADLTAAQADLAAQQATLAAQVAAIAALVDAQVVGGIAPTVTAGTWVVSTSMETKASTTITVPTGYTRAIVQANAGMHFQDSSPNGGWVQAVIAGGAGSEMGGLANLNVGVPAFHTAALTGLSGGTITLEAQVRASVASSATTGRIAQISGFAVFLR